MAVGLLAWWARLLAVGVVVLVALVIYTTFPPLVQFDPHMASLADEYPTTRILRDSWGIPHIFAKTDAEVAFGLAYAHAQDDFATIQKALLASRGQLATIEGKTAYMNDYLVHLLRLRERVDAEYDKQLSPHMREVLSAYADGLNFFAYWHTTRVIATDLFPISPQDVVACFVNKIPSFIKLDEVVRKLAGEGKDTKAQRLMNLEAQKSDMRETLGRRWTQLQRYVVSLVPLLADSLPTEQAGVVVATEPRAAATLTTAPAATLTATATLATTDAHHEPEAFGVVTEEAAAAGGSGGGVEIDGVVYTQTGANATAVGDVQAAAVPGEPAQAHGGDAQSADVESTYSDDASAERGGDDEGEAPLAKRAFASNAFAVSGRKTKDGSTFLAINSHQPWAGPFSWYEAHLHSEEGWNFVGGVFPGCPIPLSGHNRQLGWGHTVNSPDVVDVYELTMDKDHRLRYLFDGEWHTLESKIVPMSLNIFGRWSWEVEREVLWSPSHNAPVIQNPRGTYAIRYCGSERIDQLEQWLAMTKATTFEEWSAALGRQTMPLLNAVYADHQGNIFYGYNALLPQNRSSADHDWSAPVPGNTSSTVWPPTYVPWDRLPRVLNPSSGFVQNCNSSPFRVTSGGRDNNPSPADFDADRAPAVSGMIERRMTNRALRALELLSAALVDNNSNDTDSVDSAGDKGGLDADQFVRIKFDETYARGSLMAYLVNHSLAAYDQQVEEVGKEQLRRDRPMLVRAMALLRSWDLAMSGHSIAAPLAFFAFRHHLAEPGAIAHRFYTRRGDREDGDGDGQAISLDELGLTPGRLLDDVENAGRDLKWGAGRMDPEWSHQQRLIRGRAEFDLSGGPDVLHTIQGTVDIKKARVVADSGDGYVQIVRWDAHGQVHSQAVQPYGANTFTKSLHFRDQAPLFAERRLREVHMEERLLMDGAHLEEAYRPGREDELGKRALGLLGEIGVHMRKQARASANAAAAAAATRGEEPGIGRAHV